MADDNFTITVKGASGRGGGDGGGQTPRIDTSALQRAVNEAAEQLRKINTTQFQKNVEDLGSGIKEAAASAENYAKAMERAQGEIDKTLSALHSSVINSSNQTAASSTAKGTKDNSDTKNSINAQNGVIKSVTSLKESIDKLTGSIGQVQKLRESIEGLAITTKESGKNTEDKNEAKAGGIPAQEDRSKITDEVKKILATVGVGAIIKQFAENEIIAPARTSGMLIGANVVSNPNQAGASAIESYQTRVVNETKLGAGAIGGIAGALLGSILPGIGTVIGAGLGYAAGSMGTTAEARSAVETPILQRSLQSSFYSNLSGQQGQFGAFGNAQYGAGGFGSTAAFQDPYLESRATLGRSYSRFAGGSLGSESTTNILKSLTAQGASSPGELAQTGNLLGQIARYTGKGAQDTEKLFKTVERSGMNPNEGLSKTLALLQSGMSATQAEKILQNTSQRSEAFSAGQSSYFGASPFHQYMSQQVGKITGVNPEEFFKGDEKSVARARNIFTASRKTLSKGGFDENVINAELLNREGITSAMAENNLAVPKTGGQNFLQMGAAQQTVIDTQNKAIVAGAKGRSPDTIVSEALSEIGKSTQSFSVLQTATNSLSEGFHELQTSLGGMLDSVEKFLHIGHSSAAAPSTNKKIQTQTAEGR